MRGVSGDDPEGGAGSGVSRRAARNRSPREARDPARQALRPGCEELAARIRKATARLCRAAGAEGDGSAAPRPKTATVERREASVPRHGKFSLHDVPCRSIPLHVTYCNIAISLFDALLRSMVLHSYISDTDRTRSRIPNAQASQCSPRKR